MKERSASLNFTIKYLFKSLVTVICFSVLFAVTATAVNIPSVSSSKPLITYTYNSSGKIYAYTDSSLRTKTGGYIDCAKDECKIIEIKDSAVKVKYPVSGGTKTAWFSREAFTYRNLKSEGAKNSFKAKASVDTYRWKGKSTKFGSIAKNDICYLLRGDEKSDWLQIIYPISDGYKMGWIKNADYIKILPVAESVKLDKTSVLLKSAGATQTIKATISPDDAIDNKITWKSSDISVATVSSSGLVTAKANGTTTITATTSNGKKATATVTVNIDVPVSSVALNRSSATLIQIGETISLTATVQPSNATNKTITWSTSNSSVATVSSSGVVTAKSNGTATITAASSNGKTAVAQIKVEVEEEKGIPVTSIVFDKTSVTLTGVGSTAIVTASVNPSDATDKTIKWKTSDSSVAKIQVSGNKYRFTALKLGETTYTATATNGKSATITVKVVAQKATGISLNKNTVTLSGKGKTTTLSATVKPDNTTDKAVKWETSDKKVATVSSSGKVTAVDNGTATITAKTSNGKTATCKIVVSEVKAKSIELNKSSVSLSVGETQNIKATVSPSNSTDEVAWSTSDKNIATVSSSGKITAKKAGSCTVTAKTTSGKTDKVKVTVTGKYVAYTGLNYKSVLDKALSSGKISKTEYTNRLSVLNKAKKMVTVVWVSPVTFSTWKGSSGSYNSNKKMLYSGNSSSNYKFVKGCKYVGIPYAANSGNNKYDDTDWLKLIAENGIKKSKLEGTVNYLNVKRTNCTFRGIDCSGFVYRAYNVLDNYNLGYLSTSGLLSSSSWKKLSASNALPGDILLKSGHVMIYVGKTSNGKIAVMESVADGKNGYSGSRYYTFNSVSAYNYYRYSKISK